jgi:predicted TIM-barrel fold metal-dependent hydrolase
VRGLRLRSGKGSVAEQITRAAQRIAPLSWHAQLRIGATDYVSLEPTLERFPIAFVIDHIGQVLVEEGIDAPSFPAIRRIARNPRCWIKLSAPDDADLVDLIERWMPDAALRKQILVDNPARLYRF